MRASRLLSILILLQLRVRLTAEALAQEFEVSVRTIYRDIDELSAAGIPVYGDRGPGGGFQLLEGWRTKLTGLASDEAEAMFMIGLPEQAAELGLGQATARASSKLLAALPTALTGQAGRIAERFHLDPVDWYRTEAPATHLPTITRAVLDQRRIAMTYDSWKATRDWNVAPLGLVLKAGAWYLVADAQDSIRLFRVSNILKKTVLSESFERPADFDLAHYWSAELARFEAGLRPETALLKATALGLKRLSQLGTYAADAVRAAVASDAGTSVVQFPFENIDQAALALLGIGPEIEIMSPDALRTRIAELAKEVMQRNADT
jgi:predicted DNA-binding transcriptional regulator YafY